MPVQPSGTPKALVHVQHLIMSEKTFRSLTLFKLDSFAFPDLGPTYKLERESHSGGGSTFSLWGSPGRLPEAPWAGPRWSRCGPQSPRATVATARALPSASPGCTRAEV